MANIVELSLQDFRDEKAFGPYWVADTVKPFPQGSIGIEDHKVITNEENLVERLATTIASQYRPYLALGHSPLAFEIFVHDHIEDFDLKIDLA